MHSVLRDYLLQRFALQSHEIADAMHRRAAEACLAAEDYFPAARFYWKVGDYKAILAMPFTDQYFFNNLESDLIPFIAQVFAECPPEILLQFPLTLPTIGIQFYKKGMAEHYARIVRLLEDFLVQPFGLSETELYRVKGEFEMMLFFSRFNDVAKMGEHHKKAYAYLKHVSDPPRSRIYVGNVPWAVGVPSVVSVYWNKIGGLQAALDAMYDCLPFYSQLAGGHGAGGELLMQAEVLLAGGDDAGAESFCHKTIHTAEQAGQTSSCLCAEMLLGFIGILRGDAGAYSAARVNISRHMLEARQAGLTRLGEQCLALLSMSLGKTDGLPDWLRYRESIQRHLYSVTQPHALMQHSLMLLLEKRHAELRQLTGPLMLLAQKMHYMLPQLCHHIHLAVASHEEGKAEQAKAHLCAALELALPDGLLLPFARFAHALSPLWDGLHECVDRQTLVAMTHLGQKHSAGVAAVLARLKKRSTLSPREREVALLAKERLSVEEMAVALHVSPNTIKARLKNVYRKLGVKGKAELKDTTW